MFFQEAAETVVQATPLQIWGAAGFGAIIGWLVYYINRYRTGDVLLVADQVADAAAGFVDRACD